MRQNLQHGLKIGHVSLLALNGGAPPQIVAMPLTDQIAVPHLALNFPAKGNDRAQIGKAL